MPSLKSLKTRIASVKSTQKITKAMKMVAAAKLKRAQLMAESSRPYATALNRLITSFESQIQGSAAPRLLAGTGRSDTHLIIVTTSERGLCGALNSNICKEAYKRIDQLTADGKKVKIVTIGRKGHVLMKRNYNDKVVHNFDVSQVRNVNYNDIQPIASWILSAFDSGEFDVAWLFYARFQSALTQLPTCQQLIPVTSGIEFNEESKDGDGKDKKKTHVAQAIGYEPDEETILNALVPRNIRFRILRALLENAASEQGARMTAMDNATRNAGDMIDRLTLQYNRSRQAAITKELIEIISGAEAL